MHAIGVIYQIADISLLERAGPQDINASPCADTALSRFEVL